MAAIINSFDGLSAEAAEKLAAGQVEAVKAKISAVTDALMNAPTEKSAMFERVFSQLKAADGNCGNGCA
jgi:alpha-D-ribose 1-methylphosphonate 5-triphosphate synthase subunit PhnG